MISILLFIFMFRFKRENKVNEVDHNHLPFMAFFFSDLIMNFQLLRIFHSQGSLLFKSTSTRTPMS